MKGCAILAVGISNRPKKEQRTTKTYDFQVCFIPFLISSGLNTKVYKLKLCLLTNTRISNTSNTFLFGWNSKLEKNCLLKYFPRGEGGKSLKLLSIRFDYEYLLWYV